MSIVRHAVPKSHIIKFAYWNQGKSLKELEEFVKPYEAYFEYRSEVGWCIQYLEQGTRTYKTLQSEEGYVFLVGYKWLVILTAKKFAETYAITDNLVSLIP